MGDTSPVIPQLHKWQSKIMAKGSVMYTIELNGKKVVVVSRGEPKGSGLYRYTPYVDGKRLGKVDFTDTKDMFRSLQHATMEGVEDEGEPAADVVEEGAVADMSDEQLRKHYKMGKERGGEKGLTGTPLRVYQDVCREMKKRGLSETVTYRTQSGQLLEAALQSTLSTNRLVEQKDPGFERGLGLMDLAAEKAAAGKGTETANTIGQAFLLMFPTLHRVGSPFQAKHDWLKKLEEGAKALAHATRGDLDADAGDKVQRAAHLCRKAYRDFSQVSDPTRKDIDLAETAYRSMHAATLSIDRAFLSKGPADDAIRMIVYGVGQIASYLEYDRNG